MNLKNLTKDPRLLGIIQKHVGALSREIAEELSQPLLEQLGLTQEDIDTPPALASSTVAAPVVPKALLYDKRSRVWICPCCKRFSNQERRSVTTHLRFCRAETPEVAPAAPAKKPNKKPQKRKTRRQNKKKA